MASANLVTLIMIFSLMALLYRLRRPIVGALRRFDARNAQRRADEARALFDRTAHYRQTLVLADEQVEAVTMIRVADERTGQPIDRFLFLGEQYATRADAEAMRQTLVVSKAREFYIDLDRNWLPRHGTRHEPTAHVLPALGKPDSATRSRP